MGSEMCIRDRNCTQYCCTVERPDDRLSLDLHRQDRQLRAGKHVSTETTRLIRNGEGRKGEIIYLSLHCHHQNDSCIKMGSDESHFNVSLVVGG